MLGDKKAEIKERRETERMWQEEFYLLLTKPGVKRCKGKRELASTVKEVGRSWCHCRAGWHCLGNLAEKRERGKPHGRAGCSKFWAVECYFGKRMNTPKAR